MQADDMEETSKFQALPWDPHSFHTPNLQCWDPAGCPFCKTPSPTVLGQKPLRRGRCFVRWWVPWCNWICLNHFLRALDLTLPKYLLSGAKCCPTCSVFGKSGLFIGLTNPD